MTADPNDCLLRKTSQFPTEMFKESKPTSLMKMLHETFTQLSNAVETHPFLEGYFRSRFPKSTFTSATSLGRTNEAKMWQSYRRLGVALAGRLEGELSFKNSIIPIVQHISFKTFILPILQKKGLQKTRLKSVLWGI